MNVKDRRLDGVVQYCGSPSHLFPADQTNRDVSINLYLASVLYSIFPIHIYIHVYIYIKKKRIGELCILKAHQVQRIIKNVFNKK